MNNPIISIMTKNITQSVEFYTTILGFTRNSRMALPGVTLQFLQLEQMTVELVELENGPDFTAGTGITLTFLVQSFEPILEKLASTGETLPIPFTLPSGVEMLRFTDPNGVQISFVNDNSFSH